MVSHNVPVPAPARSPVYLAHYLLAFVFGALGIAALAASRLRGLPLESRRQQLHARAAANAGASG